MTDPNRRRTPTRRRRTKSRRRSGFRWGLALVIIFAVIFLTAAGTAAAFLYDTLSDLPQITNFKFQPAETSFILDKDGEVITRVPSTENRIVVDLDDIPEHVRNAFIAIEDERFNSHIGVDIFGIARALVNDIRGGHLQGGSTITQQLVRNTIPLTESGDISDNLDRTLTRKIREAVLAIELERRYTKNEILEMYLNQINLGHHARGVEAAARLYFDKSISEVTISEAAILGALPKAPNTYSPLNNPDLSEERRNLVLAKMLEHDFISQEEYEAAVAQPVEELIHPGEISNEDTNYPYPYFVDYVLENLIHELGAQVVQSGGLRIRTTLDPKIQAAAENAINQVLDKDFPLSSENPQPQAAVVVIDQHTGAIRALVGGRKHDTVLGLNRAWHKPWASEDDNTGLRQPGSAFKPLSVYTPALAQGFTAASVVDDVPSIYPSGGGQHVIENYDDQYTGLITLREAVRRSVNVASARFLEKIGIGTGWEFAQRLGIETLTTADRDISPLAAGGLTRGVSVLNMAEAYATIANGGTHIEPFAIMEIRDSSGKLIKSYEPEKQAVMDPKVAYVMTDILRSVVEPQGGAYNINSGTGASARISGWQVAGKTGTTESTRDVWFVGYTPVYTAAVWMGYDQPKPMGSSVCGGCYPAPIWRLTMEAALEGMEPVEFPRPDGLVTRDISIKSGKLASPITPSNMIRRELFVRGTEPTELDDAFVEAEVCKEDPNFLYSPGCGCEKETGVFLNRPIITAQDMIPVARAAGKSNVESWAARFVPQDMKLALPASACEDAEDAEWNRRRGGPGNGSIGPDGVFSIDVYVERNRLDPIWFAVPAETVVRMTIVNEDDDHVFRLESERIDPDSIEFELEEGERRTVEFTVLEPGVVTLRCEDHPDEVLRIVVGPANAAEPPVRGDDDGEGSSPDDEQPSAEPDAGNGDSEETSD